MQWQKRVVSRMRLSMTPRAPSSVSPGWPRRGLPIDRRSQLNRLIRVRKRVYTIVQKSYARCLLGLSLSLLQKSDDAIHAHYNSLLGGWLRPLGSGSDAGDVVVLLFVKTHTHDYASLRQSNLDARKCAWRRRWCFDRRFI